MKSQTESALADSIEEFFKFYKEDDKFKYLDIIDGSLLKSSIKIFPKDIIQFQFDKQIELYEELMKNPKKFVLSAKKAIEKIFAEHQGSHKKFDILIDDVDKTISVIEALGNQYINDIVTIRGIISSVTKIYNLATERTFLCPEGHISRSRTKLTKCQEKTCQLNPETLEDITPKENFSRHRTLYIRAEDDLINQEDELKIDVKNELCDVCNIGDRIKLTGIIETQEDKQKKTYENVVNCLSISKLDDVDLSISKEEQISFKQYPEMDDFYFRLIHSVAPSIYGWVNVKESILLALAGSPTRLKRDGTKVRGEIHNGLFGDPGTAKTKFGEWITANFPRSKLVMGKGATSTGLTMGLEDGPEGRKVLRSGAMVNCRDGGIVILDEFPRTDKDVIDGLYTVVENGEASISKTGFQTKIKANASLILTGNAHDGKWSENMTISDNLAVDVTFLTRLDYSWVFLDEYDEKTDSLLSDAVIDDVDYDEEIKPFNVVTFQKYLKYCRMINPKLTKDSTVHLKKAYLELRKDEQAKENGITLRHLDTLIRSTLAIARLHQHSQSTVEDADKAIDLIRRMFAQQNISINQADNYVQRNLSKALEILYDESLEGLDTVALFDKIMLFGDERDQEQVRIDLGTINSIRENKKYRAVIESLKRSPRVNVINQKPLILAYDHNKGDLRRYSAQR